MRMIIVILAVEKITAAALRVEVPKQNTETAPGQEAGQVDRGRGFANTTFDIINCNLFQERKLVTKREL